MRSKILLPLFSFTLLLAVSAKAQVYLPPPPPVVDMNKMIMNNYLLNQIRINAIGRSMITSKLGGANAKSGTKTNTKTNSPAKQTYAAKLGFGLSGYSLLAEKMTQNSSRKMSAAEAQKLNEFFTALWRNYQFTFKDENQRLGMPFNDLATTMTYYILNNYMIVNNLSSLESEKSVAVYRQVAPVLLNNSEIANLADKDKELLGELLVSIGGMPSLILQTTRDQQKAKQAAQQNLERIFGQNAANLRITENGVEL